MTADKRNHEKGGKLTIYHQVVSYLLKTYATDHVIGKAEAKAKARITSFKKRACMTAVCYSEALCKKALTCGME